MVDTLKNKVEGANCLIMLLNGENPRFDDSLQQMVREMKVSKKSEELESLHSNSKLLVIHMGYWLVLIYVRSRTYSSLYCITGDLIN